MVGVTPVWVVRDVIQVVTPPVILIVKAATVLVRVAMTVKPVTLIVMNIVTQDVMTVRLVTVLVRVALTVSLVTKGVMLIVMKGVTYVRVVTEVVRKTNRDATPVKVPATTGT